LFLVGSVPPASPRHRKRQHVNHITGKQGVDLVKQRLPTHWVVRELNPDYGLDIHIEVFDLLPDGSGSADTLGEHFYAQVKGVHGTKRLTKPVRHRGNVAKADPDPTVGELVDIEVIAFSLEVNELLTVEAMGAAVPALLCVADLDSGTVHYVCLNDYIAKVLLPADPDYTDGETVTIHLPGWNVLDPSDISFAYLWLLARRGKYYAAFNQFVYQHVEMGQAVGRLVAQLVDPDNGTSQLAPDIVAMLGVFLRANLRLDVWETSGPGHWSPLTDIREGYEVLLEQLDYFTIPRATAEVDRFRMSLEGVMFRAANLGRMYEELVREWRLPTALATLTDDHPASNYRVTP
jgi:hypothetical protein